jgi:FkbM family methyltransferase
MSTTLKTAYLRVLEKLGKPALVARSVFGYPYRISLGDMFSENPYYNPYSNVGEILACAAWVIDKQNPVVYDIGAHCGFISSQLAALLRDRSPVIVAFEPIPPTYADLVASIDTLQLGETIHAIPLALSDSKALITMNYSKWASMFAQVVPVAAVSNQRSGHKHYKVVSMPLDDLVGFLGVPSVIKIDVEGWEVPVLHGISRSIQGNLLSATAWCLEWNPEALGQTGYSTDAFFEALPKARYYYLNDYEGQRERLLTRIDDPRRLEHVCNLFAIPSGSDQDENWKEAFFRLKAEFGVAVSEQG